MSGTWLVPARWTDQGVRCPWCYRPFKPGDSYGTVPDGMVGSIPVSRAVCLTCLGPRDWVAMLERRTWMGET